jgi:hypothetical protein
MNKIIMLFFPVIFFGCTKGSQTKSSQTATLGYNHSTPQGMLLNRLCEGSNKVLASINYSYFNSGGTAIQSYNHAVTGITYLLFKDDLTVNPNYVAISIVEGYGYSPILDNTSSEVRIENGIDILYYQPDVHSTIESSPSTVVKIPFTLSGDNKTLTLTLTDNTAGTATEQNPVTYQAVTFSYASVIKTYVYTGP